MAVDVTLSGSFLPWESAMPRSPRPRPALVGPDDCVVLFVGVCNLCNRAVQFLLPRDPAGRLKFTAIQSEAGQAILRWCGYPLEDTNTMVFVEQGRAYSRSTAVFRLVRYLNWPWPLLAF